MVRRIRRIRSQVFEPYKPPKLNKNPNPPKRTRQPGQIEQPKTYFERVQEARQKEIKRRRKLITQPARQPRQAYRLSNAQRNRELRLTRQNERNQPAFSLPRFGFSRSERTIEFAEKSKKKPGYTKPELRERLKDKIKASNKGGKPGQWSARKSQLLAAQYKREGGGYRGKKSSKAKSLDRWTGQDWQAYDGGNSRKVTRSGKRETRRYLPRKAWEELSTKEKYALNRSKAEAERRGEQYDRAPRSLQGKLSRYY